MEIEDGIVLMPVTNPVVSRMHTSLNADIAVL
jgi:hypothetical protein